MATYKPLSTDFKDDILASQNSKRKYTQVNNSDGTVSFQDSTAYSQVGSSYGAKEVNEEREAINNIYANKLVSLDEIDLVTEEGYFVDAKAVKELNNNFNSLRKNIQMFFAGSRVCNISLKDNTSVSVISNSDINKALGISDASNANVAVSFSNGDGGAQKVHVQGATYENGTWYATLASGAKAGPIRINYIIAYFGTSTSSSRGGSSSAKVQSKTITPRTSEQVVTPDTGYDYLAEVTVQGIPYSEQDDSSGGTTVNIG
nr:MAG TPA: hypothetical protein [Caudoviricetes sp.]